MGIQTHWKKEPGARLAGSRELDGSKLQAPAIVRIPAGGFRLFYTAIGPAKPYAECQGYILSAVSEDGLTFHPEPGIRLAPQPELPHMSLRILSPSVTSTTSGHWRMYFESRGEADSPTVICSALSHDLLNWKHEPGIRISGLDGIGGPRYLTLPDGRGRLYCFASECEPSEHFSGHRLRQGVISAITTDGQNFEIEPGYRLLSGQTQLDTSGITSAQVALPTGEDNTWTMVYSAWQDVPTGTIVPVHPSQDPNAITNGQSANFAAASIASDMAGYRSRIFATFSEDGLAWTPGSCVIEGAGHGRPGLDAVHAEDMSLVPLEDGRYRMYYAACDQNGIWRIASAVTSETNPQSP